MLANFFYSLDKKQLFNGSRWDLFVTLLFGWTLPIYFMFPRMWAILILDQVSRHVFRDNKWLINYHTRMLKDYILDITPQDISQFSLNELTFISLATRHLIRLISKSREDIELHKDITHQFELLIEAMESRFSNNQYVTEVSRAVHIYNKFSMRKYRFIPKDYKSWEVVPEPETSSKYFIDFLGTPIGKYTITTIEKFFKKQIDNREPMTFCVMCSGGIDSMTLARIFNGLRMMNYFPSFKYHVIHIDWKVRNESEIEAREIGNVMDEWGMNYEIVESTVDPENPHWDTLSTDFRFEILKKNSDWIYCYGHVITDLVENLVCNVCLQGTKTGKQTYFDLFGMEEFSGKHSEQSERCLPENSGETRNDVNIFRPLLLHNKPNDTDTPFLKDNAETLDIKRRIVRRLLKDFEYSTERIKTVYTEALEIRKKYSLKNPFEYDPSWTLAEWRQVMSNYGVKKGVIREIMTAVAQEKEMVMFQRGKHLFKIANGTIEISEATN